METTREDELDESWVPGTVVLTDVTPGQGQLNLVPVPTSDPNDPLNWSSTRKTVNFTIVCAFVFWTFVELDIAFAGWEPIKQELNFTTQILNTGTAVNYGGLAIGCIFFIPLAHKFGRRPLYILSTVLQLAASIWYAQVQTPGDLIGCNVVSGIGGAISEIIVQLTVADIYFVHQHGTMNGWYVISQSVGTFLGPVAAGYIVLSQGWRWTWWWCAIFLGVTLLVVIFFFEESKYVPPPEALPAPRPECPSDAVDGKKPATSEIESSSGQAVEIKPKSYRQRMKLITKTDEPILTHFYQPLTTLFTFPPVAYCAITYGFTLCWFAIMTSLVATYMVKPPWNFGANGVGLFNLPPFIGSALGFPFGGYMCDKWIMWLSKRNGGIYEPEMRLWFALPMAIICPAGILMFGLGLAYGIHWVLPAVGFGVYGFTFGSISATALSYLMDCHQEIIGDALVGVIFMRNIISLIVLFVLTPWVNGIGLQNTHIICAVIAFVVYLLPIPLLVWGKAGRRATAKRYRKMAEKQLTLRPV